MIVSVEKITDYELAMEACRITSGAENLPKIPPKRLYDSEHSPMRTQIFWITLYGIPSFVSTHLVRHKVGVEHWVQSKRDDTYGDGTEDRNTPVNHVMMINAQSLMQMMRLRLCNKAHLITRMVMAKVKEQVMLIDPGLGVLLVPKCIYMNRCNEFKMCDNPHFLNRLKN